MVFVKMAGLICLWLVVLLMVPAALRDRRRRSLWLVLVLVAAEATLYRTEIQAPLYSALNGHLVFLGVHLVSVVEAVGVLYLLTKAINRPRYRFLAIGSGVVTTAAMIAMYWWVHPGEPTVSVPPEVPLAYWNTLSIFHTIVHLLAVPLCWYAATQVRGAMRLSLITLGAGMILLCVPWALNLGWLLTGDTGWLDPIPPIDATTGLCLAIAAAPPLAVAAHRRLNSRRAMRRLAPLWNDLIGAVPAIVFSPTSTGVAMPRRPRFGLYRRVVEIRDAMMTLRAYVQPTTLHTAEQHVRNSGLVGPEAQAAVTACWIAAAIRSKDQGEQPSAQQHDLAGLTGENLDDEVTHLLRVARLYRSPLVARLF